MSAAPTNPEAPRYEQMLAGFEKVLDQAGKHMMEAGFTREQLNGMAEETARGLREDFLLKLDEPAVVEVLIRGFTAFTALMATAVEEQMGEDLPAMLYIAALMYSHAQCEEAERSEEPIL